MITPNCPAGGSAPVPPPPVHGVGTTTRSSIEGYSLPRSATVLDPRYKHAMDPDLKRGPGEQPELLYTAEELDAR